MNLVDRCAIICKLVEDMSESNIIIFIYDLCKNNLSNIEFQYKQHRCLFEFEDLNLCIKIQSRHYG